ncbi:tapasin-related protein-like isoform X2 [Hyla sarda]|uniref:tapasin-related protein-like isoform X2 n=1 Tax=Hyla sarda TaxID=327740 RepID=UPI0024C3E82B|nr:tapasin-related protein-like isoform X2 [Hyla sarda]
MDNYPVSLILCVLLIGGTWSIEDPTYIKLPCLYERPNHHLLGDQPVSLNTAWVVLGSGQGISVQNLDFEGVTFIFKDSPVNLMPFLKEGITDLKCEIKPYFTANTQILWPGVKSTDNGLNSWYIYTVQDSAGKFHTATFFTKLTETAEKKEDKHHVLATFMLSTRTRNVYARLGDSVLLDCAFTVDHQAKISVTWSYRESSEVKILSYNGDTKKLQNNWKDAYMNVEELKTGNASLLVNNLKKEGLFTCTVSVASLFAEQQIHLYIRESPLVTLNVGSALTLSEGDEQKFVCDASGYYPLDVNIEWLRELPNTGLLPSVLSNVVYSSHKHNHNGTYSLSGFFLYTASLQDNGVTFTCRVEHSSLKKPIRKSVTLTVLDSQPWMLLIVIVILILVLLYCVRIYYKEMNANKTKPY